MLTERDLCGRNCVCFRDIAAIWPILRKEETRQVLQPRRFGPVGAFDRGPFNAELSEAASQIREVLGPAHFRPEVGPRQLVAMQSIISFLVASAAQTRKFVSVRIK